MNIMVTNSTEFTSGDALITTLEGVESVLNKAEIAAANTSKSFKDFFDDAQHSLCRIAAKYVLRDRDSVCTALTTFVRQHVQSKELADPLCVYILTSANTHKFKAAAVFVVKAVLVTGHSNDAESVDVLKSLTRMLKAAQALPDPR